MRQAVSCSVGSSTSINVDQLEKFAGPCCSHPDRRVRAEIKEASIIVDAQKEQR